MIKIEFLRKLDIDELREALMYMEKQTEEKQTDAVIAVYGDYAQIEVELDPEGNITVL